MRHIHYYIKQKENTKNSARKKQEKRKKIKIQTDKTTYVNVTTHCHWCWFSVFFLILWAPLTPLNPVSNQITAEFHHFHYTT